jgi:hypothetical protein
VSLLLLLLLLMMDSEREQRVWQWPLGSYHVQQHFEKQKANSKKPKCLHCARAKTRVRRLNARQTDDSCFPTRIFEAREVSCGMTGGQPDADRHVNSRNHKKQRENFETRNEKAASDNDRGVD